MLVCIEIIFFIMLLNKIFDLMLICDQLPVNRSALINSLSPKNRNVHLNFLSREKVLPMQNRRWHYFSIVVKYNARHKYFAFSDTVESGENETVYSVAMKQLDDYVTPQKKSA